MLTRVGSAPRTVGHPAKIAGPRSTPRRIGPDPIAGGPHLRSFNLAQALSPDLVYLRLNHTLCSEVSHLPAWPGDDASRRVPQCVTEAQRSDAVDGPRPRTVRPTSGLF